MKRKRFETNFDKKLVNLLDAPGWSGARLAREIGLDQTTVSAWTKGTRRPYLDQGLLVSKALGVSLEFLADPERTDPKPDVSTEEKFILMTIRNLGLDVEDVIRVLYSSVKKAEAIEGGRAEEEVIPKEMSPPKTRKDLGLRDRTPKPKKAAAKKEEAKASRPKKPKA
ncbi:helix-turn-helix domain-containing protein [Singulisphaera sp. PoT]|uniref:helix-turn-helix domain-containing protein n=1 Tax=Singulisphaera sp. PoT TaxID=3411797 RepID=UPI003BF59E3C